MTTMKVFDGTAWQVASLPAGTNATTFVGPEAPPGPLKLGDLWYDTDDVPAPVITLPVSIVNGGTGVSTAAAARTSLAMPGEELSYTEMTTNVSITATTEAGAQQVITSGARTYDGSPVIIEFFTNRIDMPATPGGQFIMQLWDGATNLGWLCQWIFAGQGYLVPVNVRRRLTPPAGSHTYRVAATVYAGTGQVCGGAGGTGQFSPAFLRITRA